MTLKMIFVVLEMTPLVKTYLLSFELSTSETNFRAIEYKIYNAT